MNGFDRIVALAVVARNPGSVGEPIKTIIRSEQDVETVTERDPTIL
jgi:hypothetical protein